METRRLVGVEVKSRGEATKILSDSFSKSDGAGRGRRKHRRRA